MATVPFNNQELGIKFEKAVRILAEEMPVAEKLNKPTMFHSLRVGVYLYEHDYHEDIVIAGLMHDILEDTDFPEAALTKAFNAEVTELVKANTKNKSIANQDDRIKELIERCVLHSEKAAIVKAADILDNFNYFYRTFDEDGVDYSMRNAKMLVRSLPDDYQDGIFDKIRDKLSKKCGGSCKDKR